MATKKETLADYVRRVKEEKGLNLRQISENAKRAGYDISHTAVNNIINRVHPNPGVETLRALAHGLGVSEAELLMFGAKGTKQVEETEVAFEKSDFADLYRGYMGLSEEDKSEVDALIRAADEAIQLRRLRAGKKKKAAGFPRRQ